MVHPPPLLRLGRPGGASAPPAVEVRYRPVLAVASGRMVGAAASLAPVGAIRSNAAAVGELAAAVLDDLASGPAATAPWWVEVPLGLGALVDRVLAHELRRLVAARPGTADRLRLGARAGDLVLARAAGGIGHLVAGGMRLGLGDVAPQHHLVELLDTEPVAALRVPVEHLVDPARHEAVHELVALGHERGLEVIAVGVDADEHLAAAHAAGIGLAQGDRFGTPGSLEKLLVTWARPA